MKKNLLFKLSTLLTSILMVASAAVTYAQGGRRVTGTVVDEDGAPLAGVYVLATGTRTGATTDVDGHYAIQVPEQSGALEFSLLGMKTESVEIGKSNVIDVTMGTGSIGLSESVVVGYGTMIRRELSSSVASVNNEALNERGSAIAIAQSMAGKMAGVNVVSTSGRPGGYTSIRVRGTGSIESSSQPIYVVDGVVDVDPAVINTSDVEKIDVLKDAAATSIYGARGSNGVIMITTKQGRSGDATITFDTKTGVNFLGRRLNMMNSEQYMEALKMAYAYDGEIMPHLVTPNENLFSYAKNTDGSYKYDADGLLIATPLYDTDWQKEAYRTALVTTNSLSFSQGNEKTQIYASLSYSDLQGILKTTWQKHMTGSIKINSQLKPWLDVNFSAMAGTEKWNANDKEWAMDNGASRTVYEMTPIIPVKYQDGTPGRANDYFTTNEAKDNPITQLENITDICNTTHILMNGGLNFHLAKGLTLSVNGSYNVRNRRYDYFANQGVHNASDVYNHAAITHEDIARWTNEDYLTYENTFFDGNLKSNFVLGASWYEYIFNSSQARAWDIPTEGFQWHNLGTATVFVNNGANPVSSGYDRQAMNSYYFRTNQVLKNRYMFGLTLRVDGASVFGANKKYGFFPAASFAWDIAQEPWFEGVKDTFDTMKLRMSYGVVGNSSIGSYNSLSQYVAGTSVFANSLQPYVVLKNMGNADLTWESAAQFDLGLDFSLFKSRIQVIADFYVKNSNRLLYNMPVPWTTGYESAMGNIGELKNTGFELTINSHNIDHKDFKWDTDLIFSTNKGKYGNLNLTKGTHLDVGGSRIEEGGVYGELYGYKRIGTWGIEEAAEAARYDRIPGEIKYLDVNNDGTINDDDLVRLGNTVPRYEISLINTFMWKGWTLMVDLGSLLKYQVYSYTTHLLGSSRLSTNMTPGILNSWTPSNQDTLWPALTTASHAYNKSQPDSFDINNGSFVRLRTVSLSYDLKRSLLHGVKFFKGCQIGVTGENLYLITGYKGGYDPETGWGGGGIGADWYAYPRPTTITGNLRLTF